MAKYRCRVECGVAGCSEVANYECDTRKEQTDLYRRYANKQWRCTRHNQPDEVLGSSNSKIVHEMTNVPSFYEGKQIGLYWGINGKPSNGFAFGPGFKAFAKDFPEGTILRVTAEVILPENQTETVLPPAE